MFAMNCPAFSYSHPASMSIQPNGNGSVVMTEENVNDVQALDIDRGARPELQEKNILSS
jgi:hypothetical protein